MKWSSARLGTWPGQGLAGQGACRPNRFEVDSFRCNGLNLRLLASSTNLTVFYVVIRNLDINKVSLNCQDVLLSLSSQNVTLNYIKQYNIYYKHLWQLKWGSNIIKIERNIINFVNDNSILNVYAVQD